MQKVISKQRLAPQEVDSPTSKAYPVSEDPQPLNSVCRTSLYAAQFLRDSAQLF